MLEDDIISWARELGFSPSDSSLSKASISKLCATSASRKVWEFLLSAFKAQQEVQAVRDKVAAVKAGGLMSAKEVAEVKQKAQLKAEIARMEGQNQGLREVWDRQAVRFRSIR